MTQRELIVVCAANLTGTDKCPNDCRKCFYGGDISITWTEYGFNFDNEGQDYIQYFPNKEAVLAEWKEVNSNYMQCSVTEQGGAAANNTLLKKANALSLWLDRNFPNWAKEVV